MKRFVVVLAALFACQANAAEFNAMECVELAAKFQKNPFGLTVGEYDTLEICAATLKAAKVNGERDEREGRAILRNFTRDGE